MPKLSERADFLLQGSDRHWILVEIQELEARAARLREAVEVLSGSANGWVDYCMSNKILPRSLSGNKTLDTQCREAIAEKALGA